MIILKILMIIILFLIIKENMPAIYFFQNLTKGKQAKITVDNIQYYTDHDVSMLIGNIIIIHGWRFNDIIRAYPHDYQLPVLIYNNGECEWSIDGTKPYIRQEFIYDHTQLSFDSFISTNGVA